jgi:hypothetical protein
MDPTGNNAHWPLDDTSWVASSSGSIREVLGGSNGTKDYWVDTNTSVNEPPSTAASLGPYLGNSGTRFIDANYRNVQKSSGAGDRLELGYVNKSNSLATNLVWFTTSTYVDQWDAFVRYQVMRLGNGAQVVSIDDNDSSADTYYTNGGSYGQVNTFAGTIFMVAYLSSGRLVTCNNGAIIQTTNGAGSWTSTGNKEFSLYALKNRWNSTQVHITFQDCMYFDKVQLTDSQILALHRRGLGLE